MILYECMPQKNLKKISGIVMILACVALLLFFVTSTYTDLPFRWVFQLCGFGCISAIIYITVRYISRAYIYAIFKNKDGSLDLTVTELSNGGKKRITVCRVSLGSLEEVFVCDKRNAEDKRRADDILANAKKEKRKRFNYTQSMGAPDVCLITLTECDEPLLITLERDGQLEKYLSGELGATEE